MKLKYITVRRNIKIYLLSFVIILIVFVMSYILYTNSNKIPALNIPMPGQEIPQVDYKVTAKFENFPTEVMVYKFKKPQNVDFYSIAKKFGLSGKVQYDLKTKTYKIKEEINGKLKYSFTYEEETGRWEYVDEEEMYLNDNPTNIPSDDEAKRIATEFLKKEGLFNENFTYSKVVPVSSGDKLTNDYKVRYKDVYFYPSINGKPVYGVSRIVVSVGDNGKIIGVLKWYKDFEEYKKVKINFCRKSFRKS